MTPNPNPSPELHIAIFWSDEAESVLVINDDVVSGSVKPGATYKATSIDVPAAALSQTLPAPGEVERDDADRANGTGQDELIAGLKRALQHPAGDHDGWTDAGMEDAFFRWQVIVNALNKALAAPVPIGEGVSAPDRIWLCGFDTDHGDISWSSCPNPADDQQIDGKQVEYVRLDQVSGERGADMAAEVPQTVDPDLVEARKMTAASPSDYEHVNDKIRRGHWLNGVYDNDPTIQMALATIKRAKALATVAAANDEAFARGVEAAAKVVDEQRDFADANLKVQHRPAHYAGVRSAAIEGAIRIRRLLSQGGGK